MKNKIQNIIILGLAFITFGCAAPLTVKYDAKFGAPSISLKESFTVAVVPYKDERKESNPKKLGDITSPVFGIDTTELIIGEKVADFVTDAFKEQFTLAGFKTQEAVPQDADFLIEGSVKAFSLDIGPKDTIEIGKRRVGKECRSRWSPYH